MLNNVISEGFRGLQTSQNEMLKHASQIAHAGVDPVSNSLQTVSGSELSTFTPVNATLESQSRPSIEQSILELRKQELIFNANAKVISQGSDMLGMLLDTTT